LIHWKRLKTFSGVIHPPAGQWSGRREEEESEWERYGSEI